MSERPKVGFVTHEPFAPPSGGGSSEAPFLVNELCRRGYAVHVFCPSFPNSDRAASEYGATFHLFDNWPMGRTAKLRTLKYLGYPLAMRPRLKAWARTVRPVGFLAQHSISAVAVAPVAQRLKIPCVANYLDFLTGFMEGWRPRWAWLPLVKSLNWFELSLPKRYDVAGVLTVSDDIKARIQSTRFPSDRLKTLRFGFDADNFPLLPVLTPRAADASPLIVMHGSMDRHHLGPILGDAIPRIVRRFPKARFEFIGPRTSSLASLAEAVAPEISRETLRQIGFVPYAEIGKRLAAADCGIVPYEDTPGAHSAFVAKAVEFGAVGTPFVSSALRGIQPFFQGFSCVRFTDFNGDAFARAVCDILDRRGPAQRLECERLSRHIHETLNWGVIAERAITFFEERVAS